MGLWGDVQGGSQGYGTRWAAAWPWGVLGPTKKVGRWLVSHEGILSRGAVGGGLGVQSGDSVMGVLEEERGDREPGEEPRWEVMGNPSDLLPPPPTNLDWIQLGPI